MVVNLGRFAIFTPGVRFLPLLLDWPLSSHSSFYQKNLLDPQLKFRQPFADFSCQIHSFHNC